MKISVYSKLRAFKTKYPFTISWRLMSHAKVINKHLTDGEKVLYATLTLCVCILSLVLIATSVYLVIGMY